MVMGECGTQRYLPWSDDALIRGESAYALLNKMGWFSNRSPLQLILDLKATEEWPSPTTPCSIAYDAAREVWESIGSLPGVPRIHGMLFQDYVQKVAFEPIARAFRFRVTDELRFCPDCIALGMHFEIQQLKFVERCPLHEKAITSSCAGCGNRIPFRSKSQNAPFSCDACCASLLQDENQSLRDNFGVRRRIAQAYVVLEKRIAAAPHLNLFSYSDFAPDRGCDVAYRHAMARMLDLSLRGSPKALSVSAPYVAVRVDTDESGRPRLERISNASLASVSSGGPRVNESLERRLAQLRVGAWATQRYREHFVCICAARELKRNQASAKREFADGRESHACNIGRGFAAWEEGQDRRAREPLSRHLWKNWGLDDRVARFYAMYVIEKACLGSAIMRFVESDPFGLSEWQRNGLSLQLIESRFMSEHDLEQAVIWVNFDQVDPQLNDACHIAGRDSAVKEQWLKDVTKCASPEWLIHTVARDYSSKTRNEYSRNWMDQDINRRVRITLKSVASSN